MAAASDCGQAKRSRSRRRYHSQKPLCCQKLAALSKSVDTKVLPGTTPEQVLTLTTNLQALAYRMQELMDARANPQAQLLVRELLSDVRAWRLKVQEAFQGLSQNPAAGPVDAFRERLTARTRASGGARRGDTEQGRGGRAQRPGRRAFVPLARRLPGLVGGGDRVCCHRGGDRMERMAGVAVLTAGYLPSGSALVAPPAVRTGFAAPQCVLVTPLRGVTGFVGALRLRDAAADRQRICHTTERCNEMRVKMLSRPT